mgnify:CR=1 FL=1
MLIEMSIKGLMLDPITNTPIVILKDKEGDRVLPIWVGLFEANAIALQIENVATPRPMTHDLLRNIITDLDGCVDRVVVSDLKDNTFFAVIHLTVRGERVAVFTDSRGGQFYGKQGDIIEGRYRVLRIGPDSVDLAYLDGRGRQTISLTGQ